MLVALPAGHKLASKSASALPLATPANEKFILYRRPPGQASTTRLSRLAEARGLHLLWRRRHRACLRP